MKKRTATIYMALALCLGITGGAYAASNNQTISAILSRDVKVTYNGEIQSFVDANGANVYPISYNGTTYLPVRAVANMLNIPVKWNGTTNTVELGATTAQPTNLVTRKNTGAKEYNYIINDSSVLEFDGSDSKYQFENGVTWRQWNGSASYGKKYVMYFDTTGFESVTFTVRSDVNAMVRVVDQDGNNITSFENVDGQVQEKTIKLNGATKIALASDFLNIPGKYTSKREGFVYFYDPILR